MNVLQPNDVTQFLDSDSSQQRIKIFTSKFKVNLDPGSNESIEFLKHLKETENLEIFRGRISWLIDFKWT